MVNFKALTRAIYSLTFNLSVFLSHLPIRVGSIFTDLTLSVFGFLPQFPTGLGDFLPIDTTFPKRCTLLIFFFLIFYSFLRDWVRIEIPAITGLPSEAIISWVCPSTIPKQRCGRTELEDRIAFISRRPVPCTVSSHRPCRYPC